MNIFSQKRKQQSAQVLPLYSIYSHITELPLRHFISCCVEGHLQSLIKEGQAPDHLLQDTWSNIQQQYADAMGGVEKDATLQLVKEIHLLQCDYNIVMLLVTQLRECYVKKFADELNKILRIDFVFDIKDLKAYDEQLNRCLKRAKAMKIQLDLKLAQYDAIEKKFDGKTVKPTREYFVRLLKGISDHAGYRITDDVSVYEFAIRVKEVSNSINKS